MTTTLHPAARPRSSPPARTLAREPRCTVGLKHYRSPRVGFSFSPTMQAVTGALAIYLEGRRQDDVLRMLFGLSVLRSATAAQVESALDAAHATLGDLSSETSACSLPTLAITT